MPLFLILFALPVDTTVLTVDLTTVPIISPFEIKKEAWIDALHLCENKYDVPKILDTNGYYSYGKYMWQMRSWLRYTALGTTRENIMDEGMQDKITRHVLDMGGWKNWYNCGKMLNKTMGMYGESM